MPLYSKEEPLAYLIFGCYLDNSPIEEQWERTRALLDWWQGSLDELHRAFFQFRQFIEVELRSYAETLRPCPPTSVWRA